MKSTHTVMEILGVLFAIAGIIPNFKFAPTSAAILLAAPQDSLHNYVHVCTMYIHVHPISMSI